MRSNYRARSRTGRGSIAAWMGQSRAALINRVIYELAERVTT